MRFRPRAVVPAVPVAVLAAGLVSLGCLDASILPDDIFEPNDSMDQFVANDNNPNAELTASLTPQRQLSVEFPGETANVTMLDPVDFFEITAQDTGTLVVECWFFNSAGDLSLELYNAVQVPLSPTLNTYPWGKELRYTVSATESVFVRIELEIGFDGNTYDLVWYVE